MQIEEVNSCFWAEEQKARNELFGLFEDTGDTLAKRPVKWYLFVKK